MLFTDSSEQRKTQSKCPYLTGDFCRSYAQTSYITDINRNTSISYLKYVKSIEKQYSSNKPKTKTFLPFSQQRSILVEKKENGIEPFYVTKKLN